MLQSLLVNPHNDNAGVGSAGTPNFKSHIEQALLDILQKHEAGTAVGPDTGEREQQKPRRGHKHGDGDIDLAC
jgi:ribosomal protein S12 methylthiotransferase accessory factor YcaO